MAAWGSTDRQHDQCSAWYKALCKIEKAQAQTRATVERPLRVIKRPFGNRIVRYRGLVKNAYNE